ncbi:MAG: hypothetical protein ACYCZ0_02365 [Minisyncoccota bacterium]
MSILTPFLALALLLVPNAAFAHGGAALTFTSTTTEGYIVDVDIEDGYLESGVFTRIDFGLFADVARTKSVDFTDMWVRIVDEDSTPKGTTLFAGPIAKPDVGGNGFAFRFPKAGVYTLSVRYNDANQGAYGETVADAEFALNVSRSADENTFGFGVEFWVGLLAGLFGTVIAVLPFVLQSKRN